MSVNFWLLIYQLITNFLAKYQLTTICLANCQLTTNPISTLFSRFGVDRMCKCAGY